MNFELSPEQQLLQRTARELAGAGRLPTVSRDRERLRRLVRPGSVALIGVSDDPEKVTGRPLRYLLAGGFRGPVYAVNPHRATVQGQRSYGSVEELPMAPDVACVMVPPEAVPPVVAACARRGVGGAIVFSGGFAELGEDGRRLQRAVLDAAAGMPVVGPNSVGIINIAARAFVSPSLALERLDLEAGAIALVSQSGGMLGALLSRGTHRGLRFSHLVSTGNEADLDAFDFVDLLLDEPEVRAIALFLEAVRAPDKVRLAADRARGLGKPLVVYKLGRSAAGERAAASHTGALVGTDAVWNAFFRQRGMVRVSTVEALLEVASFLATAPPLRGPRVAIFTSTGGAASVIADRCGELGLELPAPDERTAARLATVMPGISPRGNPIDLTLAGLQPATVREVCAALAESNQYDALVAVLGSSSEFHPELTAKPLADAIPAGFPVAVYVSPQADETVRLLERSGRSTFRTPEGCAEALTLAYDYYRRLRVVRRRPPTPRARIAPSWLPPDGGRLTEWEALRLFSEFGVPMARGRPAETLEDARAAAQEIGYPIAVKALSRRLVHKSECGALALNVRDDADLASEFGRLLRSVPGMEGVLVMEMAPPGVEVLVGMKRDPVVGLTLAVGLGGTAVEIYGDVALRVLPVGPEDVDEMIRELRAAPLFFGFRGRPGADTEALADAVAAFAGMGETLADRLIEAEINPFVVLPRGRGVRGVDAVAMLASPRS